MPVHPELLAILRCPRCRGDLKPLPTGDALACAHCQVMYPVVDDIPQLLVEEARPLRQGHQGDQGDQGDQGE